MDVKFTQAKKKLSELKVRSPSRKNVCMGAIDLAVLKSKFS